MPSDHAEGLLRRHPALCAAVICGSLLGVLLIVNAVLINVVQVGAGGYLTIVPCLCAYWAAGIRATRATGRIASGLLAGGLTGLLSSLVGAAGTMAIVYAQVGHIRQAVQAEAGAAVVYTNEQIIAQRALGVVAGLLLATAAGLTIGTLGGLRSSRPHQVG